ncbi:MAG: hypothetical protein EBT22_04450 [Chloroflexi bacterium]|nr:hypothetical protein [Chloroflexota bacterium]
MMVSAVAVARLPSRTESMVMARECTDHRARGEQVPDRLRGDGRHWLPCRQAGVVEIRWHVSGGLHPCQEAPMTVIPTAATPHPAPVITHAEEDHPAYLWRDGHILPWAEANVHASSLGWSTMAAVFEGIKAYANPHTGVQWGWQFAEHYQRFAQSMRLQRMRPEFTPVELADISRELLRANGHTGDTYIRPLAWLSDVTWFTDGESSRTSIVIITEPFSSHLRTGRTVKSCISTWIRVGDNQLSPRVKCISNYQNSRLALIEAKRNGFDQPILLNQAGKVTEGPASCLFLVRDGVMITPSLTSGVLSTVPNSMSRMRSSSVEPARRCFRSVRSTISRSGTVGSVPLPRVWRRSSTMSYVESTRATPTGGRQSPTPRHQIVARPGMKRPRYSGE